MAEKKPVERKIVPASEAQGQGKKPAAAKPATTSKEGKTIKQAPDKKGNPVVLRILAVVFWLLGIGCEVFAILILNGTVSFANPATGADHTLMAMLIALAVDLIFVIIGSQLWKKSNDIDPASEKNKLKFFLWNNMGLIASVLAFAPIIVLFLKDKDMDKKTKTIVTVAAVIMLLIAGASSVDYNPASAEDLAEAETTAAAIGVDSVYWTPFGRRYHLDPDCQSLKNSATIYQGSIDQAFEANRNTPCHFCAKDMEMPLSADADIEGEDIDEVEDVQDAA